MPAGRVVFWTLVGGGSVALTAFALKYYLKRKSSTCPSVCPAIVQRQSDSSSSSSEAANAKAEDDDVDVKSAPLPELSSVTSLSPEKTLLPAEVPPEIMKKVVTPAEEASSVEAAESHVGIAIDESSSRPKVIISSRDNDDDDVDETTAVANTPPTTSFGYLVNDVTTGTPPTPPPTPMPMSRDEEGVTPMYDPSTDLFQSAIQGRLARVKPRYHSTDSMADDREEEEAVDENVEDSAPDVEGGGEGDAAVGDDAEAAASAALAGKLQPICEEGVAATPGAAVAVIAETTETPETPETKPKSPYYRRKRRSVQTDTEEMKLRLSPSLSPASSPPKNETVETTSSAAAIDPMTPQKTPRLRRKSDRRSTGEIVIDDVAAWVGAEATKVNGVSVSSADSSGNGCDESTSSIDFSFMSETDDVMKEIGRATPSSTTTMASAAAAATATEVDLLDGIEDVTLDDLLRDISSMSEPPVDLTVSMVVQYDGGNRKDDVDEDLAKHLDLAEDLVLDDNFYGGVSSSGSASKETDDDLTPLQRPLISVPSESSIPDLIFNEPREASTVDEDSYDMHVSIGFTEKPVFDEDEPTSAEMAEMAEMDVICAGGEASVPAKIDASADDVSADAITVDATADAGAKMGAKATKPPKRVVRPRRERPSLDFAGAHSKSASAKEDASKEEASPKRSPTAAATKSPPGKSTRGTGKRSGIPRHGFQP